MSVYSMGTCANGIMYWYTKKGFSLLKLKLEREEELFFINYLKNDKSSTEKVNKLETYNKL